LRVFGADIKLRIKEHRSFDHIILILYTFPLLSPGLEVQFFEIDACFLPKAFESGAYVYFILFFQVLLLILKTIILILI
jgi:hypothetical protein